MPDNEQFVVVEQYNTAMATIRKVYGPYKSSDYAEDRKALLMDRDPKAHYIYRVKFLSEVNE